MLKPFQEESINWININMSNQEVSRELIYDLTELKGKYHDKIQQLIQLFHRSIKELKDQVAHLHRVSQCYSQSINQIAQKLDIQHQVVIPSQSQHEFQAFLQDLRGVENKLAALKNTTKQHSPQIIEKIVEVGIPVEVVREVEVERIVEVPVQKQIVVEKLVEIEKPVFIQKIVEIEKIVEKNVMIPVTKEVEIECHHCRNGVR